MNTTANAEKVITETIERYYELVSVDVHAAAKCYGVPILAGTFEKFTVLNRRREIAAGLEAGLANAKRLGYARTCPQISSVQLLSKSTALASVLAVRFKGDGEEIERAGFTYVLHHEDGEWRIKCLIATDADKLAGSI